MPHAVHSVACVVLVNHPFGQSLHPEVAFWPNLPREHGICVVAPEFSKPATTVRHALWPELFWYSPGVVQELQSPDSSFPVLAEKVPGGQSLHPVTACTPVADEYVPAGQSWHVESASAFSPVLSLHFPAPHNLHVVLSLLAYLPASHAVQLAPAVVLTLPSAQLPQSRSPTASPVICFPAAQTTHTVWPVALSVYFPVSQSPQLD